jgi:hypothetical protein
MNESQTSSPDGPSLVDPHAIERFILDSPRDLPVSQLVEVAKTRGFDIDVLQVHRIRDRERRRVARATTHAAPDDAEEGDAEEGDDEEGDDEEGDDEEGDEAPEGSGGGAGASGQGEAGGGSSPPKRRGRKPGGPETRPGFVRSLPLDTPVEEVIRLGREQYGHELDEKYIGAIRSKLNPNRRRRQSKKSKEEATASPVVVALPAPVAAASPVVAASPDPVASPTVVTAASPAVVTAPSPAAMPATVFRETEGVDVRDVEEEFARLVIEIGLVRAEQLLGRVKDRLARLVRS